MIKLNKLELPNEIAEKIKERTALFAQLTNTDQLIPKSLTLAYKSSEIKELLRLETADKCAYCESKVSHIDYGDVEHLLPKSVFPHLRYNFENLTYVCGICNTKKGDYFSIDTPLLNPYKDNPEEHLMPVGPMVLRVTTSERGLVTQKKLDLNRSELIERRAERLETITTILDQVARTKTPDIRRVLLNQVAQECAADKEYSFVVRAYVAYVLAQISQSDSLPPP